MRQQTEIKGELAKSKWKDQKEAKKCICSIEDIVLGNKLQVQKKCSCSKEDILLYNYYNEKRKIQLWKKELWNRIQKWKRSDISD